MYTGYLLTEKTRNELLALFPPKYEKVVAHHITEQFGVASTHTPPEMPETVTVVGYIDSGDGVEGLLVEVNGTSFRPDGSRYHVTWSLADGRKAVETNKHVHNATPVEVVAVEVEPKTFTR
jgi:hypothetical protein